MKTQDVKKVRKLRRQTRTRMKLLRITKLGKRPRLTVFRSNKYFYAQVIDDVKGVTLLSVNEKEIEEYKGVKFDKASELGRVIAQKAKKKGINQVVFDKGSYKYHGRVKSFADAARKEGLSF